MFLREPPEDGQIQFGSPAFLLRIGFRLQPHDDGDVHGRGGELGEENARRVAGKIGAVEIVGDFMKELNGTLHLFGGGIVGHGDIEHEFEEIFLIDVADRLSGQETVRESVDGFIVGNDFGASHADLADDPLQIADLNTVPEFERTVEKNDKGPEEIGKRILGRQRRSESDHSGSGDQSGDVDPENALPDEHDCRHEHNNSQDVAEDLDHEIIKRIVRSLRQILKMGVDHADHIQSRPGDDQREKREEKADIEQKNRIRKRRKQRIEREKNADDRNSQKNRCIERMKNFPENDSFSLPLQLPLDQMTAEEPDSETEQRRQKRHADRPDQFILLNGKPAVLFGFG